MSLHAVGRTNTWSNNITYILKDIWSAMTSFILNFMLLYWLSCIWHTFNMQKSLFWLNSNFVPRILVVKSKCTFQTVLLKSRKSSAKFVLVRQMSSEHNVHSRQVFTVHLFYSAWITQDLLHQVVVVLVDQLRPELHFQELGFRHLVKMLNWVTSISPPFWIHLTLCMRTNNR